MTRLNQLRRYRGVLKAECDAKVDKFLAMPPKERTEKKVAELSEYIRKVQMRIRLMNAEHDRLIAADPRVLQPAH